MADRTIAPDDHPEGIAQELSSQPGHCISREDSASLYALRTAWEGIYEISVPDRTWRAARAADLSAVIAADRSAVITAETAAALKVALQDDFAERAQRARGLEYAARALHQASSLLAERYQPQMMSTHQVQHLLARYQRRLSELVRAVGGLS